MVQNKMARFFNGPQCMLYTHLFYGPLDFVWDYPG